MRRCCQCHRAFEADDAARRYDDNGVTDPYPIYQVYLACPHCGCDELEDFTPCAMCAEPPEFDDWCEAHYREILALEGASPEDINATIARWRTP
jgi:hypothetical protein